MSTAGPSLPVYGQAFTAVRCMCSLLPAARRYGDTTRAARLRPQLALPRGLQFRTQKHSLAPAFHSFIITREDGSRLYGFAYTFFERVDDRATCDTMHTLQV